MSKEEVIRFHEFKRESLFSPTLSESGQRRNLGSSWDLEKRWKAEILDAETLFWGMVVNSMGSRAKSPGLSLFSL